MGPMRLVCLWLLCVTTALVCAEPLYKDSSLPVPDRVKDLLPRLSMEEKIAQLYARHTSISNWHKDVTKDGAGAVKFMSAFKCEKLEDCVKARNSLQKELMGQNHGIPAAFVNEGLHGGAPGGTVFPMPINQGASWNTQLVNEIAVTIAQEASAIGVDFVFAPVVNMMTDPRFGRLQEGFSENPTLTAHMAYESTIGLQGGPSNNSTSYLPQEQEGQNSSATVISLAKHFAAYGAAAGGLNGGAADVSPRTLFEVYLKPWRALGRAGARATMPSHNSVMGIPAHGNGGLIGGVYREKYGFGEGVTLSDCNDIGVLQDFRIANNRSHAAALALKAGVDWDLMCGNDPASWGYNTLEQAYQEGLIEEADLDRAVSHVLSQKFAARLFDKAPAVDPSKLRILDSAPHRSLALKAAEQGIILLKNNGTLPLDLRAQRKIALIGPGGKAATAFLGSYFLPGANVTTLDVALGEQVPEAQVIFSQGSTASDSPGPDAARLLKEAQTSAKDADLALVVLGDIDDTCGEWGDRDSLDLPGGQLELLQGITGLAKKTVLILIHGRPVTFGPNNAVLNEVDAVLSAWRPGEEGGTALLNIISGAVNPSAKLPVSWPRTVGHVHSGSTPWLQPVVGKWLANKKGEIDSTGRRYDNYVSSQFAPTPLYNFGYGLSYTTWSYESMVIQKREEERKHADGDVLFEVEITVRNTGKRIGTEVVQVYVEDPSGLPFVPFWRRLIGFIRVTVSPGKKETVAIPIKWEDMAMHDEKLEMRLMPGKYTIFAGGSSNDTPLNASTAFE